jgi:hypothetical protein
MINTLTILLLVIFITSVIIFYFLLKERYLTKGYPYYTDECLKNAKIFCNSQEDFRGRRIRGSGGNNYNDEPSDNYSNCIYNYKKNNCDIKYNRYGLVFIYNIVGPIFITICSAYLLIKYTNI